MKNQEHPITNYLKGLNPKENEQHVLFHGKQYLLYRDGKYIGIATWTQDENVGDSFQTQKVDKNGRLINNVWIADKWELLIKRKIKSAHEIFPESCPEFICGVHNYLKGGEVPQRPNDDDFIRGWHQADGLDLRDRFELTL